MYIYVYTCLAWSAPSCPPWAWRLHKQAHTIMAHCANRARRVVAVLVASEAQGERPLRQVAAEGGPFGGGRPDAVALLSRSESTEMPGRVLAERPENGSRPPPTSRRAGGRPTLQKHARGRPVGARITQPSIWTGASLEARVGGNSVTTYYYFLLLLKSAVPDGSP